MERKRGIKIAVVGCGAISRASLTAAVQAATENGIVIHHNTPGDQIKDIEDLQRLEFNVKPRVDHVLYWNKEDKKKDRFGTYKKRAWK